MGLGLGQRRLGGLDVGRRVRVRLQRQVLLRLDDGLPLLLDVGRTVRLLRLAQGLLGLASVLWAPLAPAQTWIWFTLTGVAASGGMSLAIDPLVRRLYAPLTTVLPLCGFTLPCEATERQTEFGLQARQLNLFCSRGPSLRSGFRQRGLGRPAKRLNFGLKPLSMTPAENELLVTAFAAIRLTTQTHVLAHDLQLVIEHHACA